MPYHQRYWFENKEGKSFLFSLLSETFAASYASLGALALLDLTSIR